MRITRPVGRCAVAQLPSVVIIWICHLEPINGASSLGFVHSRSSLLFLGHSCDLGDLAVLSAVEDGRERSSEAGGTA